MAESIEAPAASSQSSALNPGAKSPGNLRWVICALLLFAAIINYIDRQVIGILKPTLVKTFGWTDERIYSSIVFSFQFAYALGFLVAGRVMDAIGVRRGFDLAIAHAESGRQYWVRDCHPDGHGHGAGTGAVCPRPGRGRRLPGLNQNGG